MPGEDCEVGYFQLLPENIYEDRFQNKVAARFVFQILRIAPWKNCSKIKFPVLFCICEWDTVAPSKKI